MITARGSAGAAERELPVMVLQVPHLLLVVLNSARNPSRLPLSNVESSAELGAAVLFILFFLLLYLIKRTSS